MSSQSNQKDQNISQFNKFLQNNHDFLQEKYDEYFKKTSMPTKDVNRQSAVKYIYDVFSFNKYESDQKMNATLQKSLLKNIQDFIAGLNKKKMPFNYKTAVELLKFCIENNEMFAVKYDKKDKKMKTEEPMNESTFTEKQQGGARDNKETEKVEQQQQNNEQQEQQKQNEGSDENKSENIEQNPNHVNQFAESQKQSPEKPADPELIKKNLKQMFQFYCKQQQNVGVHSTFDRISYQCKTMTLGKFLAFANSTQIVNDKVDKNLLMRKFKLVAEGKKQIQFQHFYDIMKTLAEIDQAMIPKLGVDEKINFKTKLKERSMAFNTKDLTSRDIKRDYIPKLTGHSGKLSDALYEQMRLRKQQKIQQLSLSHSKQNLNAEHNTIKTPVPNNRYESSIKSQLKQGSQIISSPNQLTNSNIRDFQEDLGFLEKMINVQETDEQWLKQYKIPHKKIVNPLPPRLMSRKESIVPNLKKRVEELERSETRQTTHLERRQFMSNNRQRQRERNSKSILN